MVIPPWAWAAGAAAVLTTGALVAASSKSSGASPPPPPTPTPTGPVQIISGHRYQVTLTVGGATNAAALLANVVPNLQAGLNAVAPNEFRFVHAIAPNDTQVVYVVDAIGGAPGSVVSESPQTFYADLNAASLGGLSVLVQDMGPSPVGGVLSPPPAQPPPAQPPPASTPIALNALVTSPAMVTFAQVCLNTIATLPGAPPGAASVVVNGNPNDPATVAAVVAFQNALMPASARSGRLDVLTWATVVSVGVSNGAQGTDAVLTDAPTITFAQGALLSLAIGRGVYPHIDYGIDQQNGNASDPAWRAALATAMGQVNATLNSQFFVVPTNGDLDYLAYATLVGSAFQPPTTIPGTSTVPVEPATAVADAAMITYAQQRLVALATAAGTRTPAMNATLAAVAANGNASDPATVAAVTLVQANFTGLQHRTTPGELDMLTFAAIVAGSLQPATPPSPPVTLTSPLVTAADVVGGAQEALAIALVGGRLPPPSGVTYGRSQVNGNAADPAFVAALQAVVPVLNGAIASGGVMLPTTGALDLEIFATLFVVAYL